MNLLGIWILLGCLSGLIPAAASLLRRTPPAIRLAASLSSAATLAYLFVLWRLAHLRLSEDPFPWIHGLVLLGIVSILTGYLISSVIGREEEEERPYLRPSFVGLVGLGLLALVYLRHDSFVTGYDFKTGYIAFGYLGKAFSSYLLVGIVMIGSNLESTYRVAGRQVRRSLRSYFMTLFALLAFSTYVLASGLLYSFLPMTKLVALVIPLSLGNFAIGHGFLKGKLLDTRVPVSRAVVYSSFTAVAAGLYLLAIGLVAQIAGVLHWSPNAIISISVVFFMAFLTILLALSREVQRQVRRFIDRNFYVKKHDYQTTWGHLSEALNPAQTEEGLLESLFGMYEQVFETRAITIALRDRASAVIRPVMGKGSGLPGLALDPVDPLCRKLVEARRSIHLDRKTDDFEYIPIYVEERAWLDATASQAVAPLLVGKELIGLIGLEKKDEGDSFRFDDLELMDNMSFQAATVLEGIRLSRELSEAREAELLSQWSSMILHDLKNHLQPLQMLASHMKTNWANPDFVKDAVNDLAGLTQGMESLIQRVARLRENQEPDRKPVDLNGLVRKSLDDLLLARSPGLEVVLDLKAADPVVGNAAQLESLIRNLVVNAVQAMEGRGVLEIRTSDGRSGGDGEVVLSVADNGPGMDPEFLRRRLFTPFATTKKKGSGLGLYQCRNIVRAHGGHIMVESTPGAGTCFKVSLKPAGDEAGRRAPLETVTS